MGCEGGLVLSPVRVVGRITYREGGREGDLLDFRRSRSVVSECVVEGDVDIELFPPGSSVTGISLFRPACNSI